MSASSPEVGLSTRTYRHRIDLSFNNYCRVLAAEEVHDMADFRIGHGQRCLIFLILLQPNVSLNVTVGMKTRTMTHLLPSKANLAGFLPMSA